MSPGPLRCFSRGLVGVEVNSFGFGEIRVVEVRDRVAGVGRRGAAHGRGTGLRPYEKEVGEAALQIEFTDSEASYLSIEPTLLAGAEL